ncbi:aldo/keto reductase [Sedimentibacter hydroxybenzoicus DSM 7310]|uniref:Aldo/keto reductase n=1 Tax=Sedimentibacter hydroxybenzoicus DSM 7310 TaxID=1123245 RepID=A0A974BGS2_SEDHY|nr:aldo/keto reductase [Sedimentibacter hydroxybenzoicus]NYB72889.1 aldo/keto reductase [Sedimentibacter hydroxybenzoicus DSM 7310]
MLTKKNIKNGDELSILGFGCMRLPSDEDAAIKLIRDAIEKGVNYFDTAYIYKAGRNEVVLGNALSSGYREKVKIATKLPPYMVNSLDAAKRIFATQLSRLQTSYIDYYLIHMLTDKPMFDKMVSLGVMEWLEEEKEKGTVKNIGFSFHGSKQDFELIIKAYPWEFCQIQYNYLDENNQATKSGLNLAHAMGIPVIVMEPLRGGRLVNNLPDKVLERFNCYDKERSAAEWALRWIWNHKEVNVILSGMNSFEQLNENIKIANDARPDSLSDDELKIFDEVKDIIINRTKVSCTGCGYCMPCPYGVNIPGCFSSINDKYLLQDKNSKWKYIQTLGGFSAEPAFASNCKECGKCEKHCPQNIEIRKELKTVKKEMEGAFFKPAVTIARKILRIK